MSNPVVPIVKTILVFGDDAPEDGSVSKFEPRDPEHFGANFQILIGSVGSSFADSFDGTICSPSWFVEQVRTQGLERFAYGDLALMPPSVVTGHGIWFMREWSRLEFETALNAILEALSPGPDWGSVASRIGRLIPWEYDYKYDDFVDEHFGEPFPPT